MKSFIRSLLFIGGMMLFLKICLVVSTHTAVDASSVKSKQISSAQYSHMVSHSEKPST